MKHIYYSCILFVALLIGGVTSAEPDPPVVRSNGLAGIAGCYLPHTIGKSRLSLSFMGSFAFDDNMVALVTKTSSGTKPKENNPYAVLYDLYPSIAFGITSYLDIAIQQPFYFDLIEGSLPAGGPGDIELSLKARTPGDTIRTFDAGLVTAFTIPYSSNTSGYFLRHSYYIKKSTLESGGLILPEGFYSAGAPTLTVTGIASLNKKNAGIYFNAGTVLPFNSMLQNAFVGALGVTLSPAEIVTIAADIYFEPRADALLGEIPIFEEPLHTTFMLMIHTVSGTKLTLGGTFNLSSQPVLNYLDNPETMNIHSRMEPRWKTFLQLNWKSGNSNHDRDNDQITDKKDKCPDVAEDMDGFQDSDGCPDIDNDKDKIPDSYDSCLNVPEDMDGFKDTDGCPDLDNDNDNIPDTLDHCAESPEDMDSFEDEDGCPDYDNDMDSIPDSTDNCPIIPEDRDGFEDEDGCPDFDNDKDAIPDSVDQCPDSAGIAGNNGCSEFYGRAKEISFGRLILPGVTFDSGTDELTDESYTELDRLLASLTDWPDVIIEIQCHTDNMRSVKQCLESSKKRGKAVFDYLVNKGVDASRLTVTGKGSSSPIADNAVEKGRLLNNRVEIHRKK